MNTAPQAEPFMVESRVPVGESRLTTHVVVPFAQAAITMALIAGVVLLFDWRPVAGGVGAIGLCVWAWRILKADGLLTRLETITGMELDGKPGIGRPGALALIDAGQARRTVAAQEPQTSDVPRMTTFATRCFTVGTSETAQGIRPNTADRANYVECRDALLTLGAARWKNPENHSAGWEMVPWYDLAQTVELIEKHVG